MSDLVRVRVGGVEKNAGRAFAESVGLEVLEESAYNPDGTTRRTTRVGGRPMKNRTSVAKKASEKQAAVTESAPTNKESS